MKAQFPPAIRHRTADVQRLRLDRSVFSHINLPATAVALMVIALPAVAFAQSGSPFDTGFTAIQTLFTGTVAKVASLIAIVIGGYQFAHGEPGSKRAIAGIVAGTGIAVLATNVLSWLWGM